MQTHDPAKVSLNFLGNRISGFADGTFISVELNDDVFALQVGSGGDTVRVRSQNQSGRVTLTLLGSAPSNDVLAAALAADKLAGTGVGTLFLKDGGGTSIVSSESAWIRRTPNLEFGKELPDREWVIEFAKGEVFVGGTVNV